MGIKNTENIFIGPKRQKSKFGRKFSQKLYTVLKPLYTYSYNNNMKV